jgi:hypothetical protein
MDKLLKYLKLKNIEHEKAQDGGYLIYISDPEGDNRNASNMMWNYLHRGGYDFSSRYTADYKTKVFHVKGMALDRLIEELAKKSTSRKIGGRHLNDQN